jgi:hypothetical protein
MEEGQTEEIVRIETEILEVQRVLKKMRNLIIFKEFI